MPLPPTYGSMSSQALFISAGNFIRELLFHGTRGNGKTEAMLMAFGVHVNCGYGSHWVGVIFRETYKELADIVAKSQRLFPRIFPGCRFVGGSAMTWHFPNGERLMFRAAQRAADYTKYHGQEFPFIGFEELTNQASSDFYLAMHSCCRAPIPGMPRIIRATTNSFGPGFHWVKERFIDQADIGEVFEETYNNPLTGEPITLTRGHLWGHWSENHYLTQNDPQYIAQLMAIEDPEKRKAWLEGSWDIAAGAMFSAHWNPGVHWIDPFPIPRTWRMTRAYDAGWSSPFSLGWYAISDGCDVVIPEGGTMSTIRGDVFRVREWYGYTGKPNQGLELKPQDIAAGIVERELLWNIRSRVKAGPADSEIFNNREGFSHAQMMAKKVRLEGSSKLHAGINWHRADKRGGSREVGRDLLISYLNQAAAKHREKPGLFVFNHCPQFKRLIPSLPRSEKDPDDIHEQAEDHLYDEVRYLLLWAQRYGLQSGKQGRARGLN